MVGLDKCFVTARIVTLVVPGVFMYGLDVMAEGADTSQNLTTFITWVISKINLECVRSTSVGYIHNSDHFDIIPWVHLFSSDVAA